MTNIIPGAPGVPDFDWRNPNYPAVYAERVRRLQRLREDPDLLAPLIVFYRDNPWQFITDWGCTFDPRLLSKTDADGNAQPALVPFILFPKQVEWCQFVIRKWKEGDPGLTEKSRDMGISWLSIALACTLCLFNEGVVIGFGSRKEEYVDKLNAPKSLFYKARKFLETIPREFLFGWTVKDAPHMRIGFPGSDSTIAGEAGDNIGRGDRASIYFVDESAFLERPQLVEASLSQTTDCRIDVSTPHGRENPFAEKRFSWSEDRIFIFDWRDDPRKDDEWYEKQKTKLDSVTLAQEVDRDYSASVSGVVIPADWVHAAVDAHVKLGIEVRGRRVGALDVADEGPDINSLTVGRSILVEECIGWSGKGSDTSETTNKAFVECDLRRIDELIYDGDGLGAGVRGDARLLNEDRKNKIEVKPFRASGKVQFPDDEIETAAPKDLEPDGDDTERLNADYYENWKAQGWFSLRCRFQRTFRAIKLVEAGIDWRTKYNEGDLISLSSEMKNLSQVKAEVSQPIFGEAKSGKMLIKKTPDGMRSPNHGDGIMMRYAPRDEDGSYNWDAW